MGSGTSHQNSERNSRGIREVKTIRVELNEMQAEHIHRTHICVCVYFFQLSDWPEKKPNGSYSNAQTLEAILASMSMPPTFSTRTKMAMTSSKIHFVPSFLNLAKFSKFCVYTSLFEFS